MRFLFFCGLFASFASAAQSSQPARYLTGGVATQAYKGDVLGTYSKWTPALHLGLQFNKKKRLNGAVMAQAGYVIAQNARLETKPTGTATPARYVRTSLISAHYQLQLNLLRTENWTCYLSQGFGLLRFVPKDVQDRKLADVNSSREAGETFSAISVILPTSLGVQYHLPNQWALGLQACLLNPRTDYLDNLSNLGTDPGKDNVLQFRFQLAVPLSRQTAQ